MPGPRRAPWPSGAIATSSGRSRSGHLTVGRPIITAVRAHVETAVRNRLAVVVIKGRGLSAWRLWPPGGAAADWCGLPSGARDIRSYDVGGVPIQAASG